MTISPATIESAKKANVARWGKYRSGRAEILQADIEATPLDLAIARCMEMAGRALAARRGHRSALYDALGMCLEIAARCIANPVEDAHLARACSSRRIIIEAGGDSFLRVCRLAFDADPVRSNMYRYAVVLRRASASGIEAPSFSTWLRTNGGIKALSYTGDGQELGRLRWVATEAQRAVKLGRITPELRRAIVAWREPKNNGRNKKHEGNNDFPPIFPPIFPQPSKTCF